MKTFLTIRTSLVIACSLFAALVSSSGQEEFDINRFVEAKLIPISLSGYSGDVQSVLKFDLEVAGFKVVSPETAQYNVTGNNNGQVEGRLTDRISKATLLESRRYTGGTMRSQAHAFADEIILKLTGTSGIAQTKIAFKGVSAGRSEVYVADYDGGNAVAVTQDNAIVAAPSWVSGQRMLFYTSYKSGYPDIYSHDLSSGERRVIARYPGLNTSAAVSPDRKRVAMILSKGGSPDLYVSNLDGKELKQLTQSPSTQSASSPCWSPDSRTICFVWGTAGTPALYLISADGGSKRRLSAVGTSSVTEPDWSPDGKWIVFTAMWKEHNVCIVPAQGGDVIALTAGEDPSWAPNSRTVIFTRILKNRRVLSLLDVKTKQVKDVPQTLGSCSQPSWAK